MKLSEWCKENKEHGELIELEWTGYDIDGNCININEITRGSRRKMLWKCHNKDCNHEWYTTIYNRTALGNNCPACAGRVVNNKNSLLLWCENNPDRGNIIKSEFTGICENGDKYAIEDITYGSSRKMLWKCSNTECKYEWYAVVKSRTRMHSNCPACAGQRATDKNNLYKWCIENSYGETIIKQWTGEKENGETIDIKDIARASCQKLKWKCEYGHTWIASVKSRTLHSHGCSYCSSSRQTSYPEQFIYYALKQLYPNAEHRCIVLKSDEHKKGIEFDIGIPLDESKYGYKALCIEYSPTRWHANKQENDNLKKRVCEEHNVRLIQIVEDTNNCMMHTMEENYICFHMNYTKQDEILFNIVNYIINTLGKSEEAKELNICIEDIRTKDMSGIMSIKYENSLEYSHPKLAEEFNCKLNGITPDKISRASGKKMYWTCPNCGYGSNGEWFVSPSERTKPYRLKACKICNRRWWI